MKKYLMISLLLLLSACQWGEISGEKVEPFVTEKVESTYPHKKVIMIIMDSMMGSLVDSSVEKGNVPALQFLIAKGKYYKDIVSPFPTMSVTIESTITTGKMPGEHKIPGLSWYDQDEDRIINYGTSFPILVKLGLAQSAYDILYHLNNTHLSPDVSTLFEELENHNLTSGAINTLVYRGDHQHTITFPLGLDESIGLPDTIQTKGPHVFSFGRFSKPEMVKQNDLSDTMLDKLGLRDEFAMEVSKALIEQGGQPDFLMVFFPDMDQLAHTHGPYYRKGFEQVDQYLQELLNAYDSWDAALDENIFILLGDHGQDKLLEDEEEVSIDLDQLYADYDIPSLDSPTSQGEIAFGVNQRMTYVYDVHQEGLLSQLADRSRVDDRIALAAWLDGDWIQVITPEKPDVFRFKPEGEWKDRYNQTWSIAGAEDLVTLQLDDAQKRISYGEYPDVLNQLYNALKSHEASKLILAAKPGYSFYSEAIPIHSDGGEHGGLHKNDALTAMIIAGTDQQPQNLRLVDLKSYVLQLMTTSPEQKSVKKEPKAQQQTKQKKPHDQAKLVNQSQSIINSVKGVTNSVVVAFDQDLYIGLQVEQWHRLRLKSIRKETHDLLKQSFKKRNIHVTTDWKLYRELEKTANELKEQEEVDHNKIKKKLKKIEQDMKG